MSMTRNGIVYDLIKSPYKTTLNGITFYFSSTNHLEKFNEQFKENRETLVYSLYKRFKLGVYINELYDLVLYNKIETRGFLVSYKGDFYKCLNNIILSGVNLIEKKYLT